MARVRSYRGCTEMEQGVSGEKRVEDASEEARAYAVKVCGACMYGWNASPELPLGPFLALVTRLLLLLLRQSRRRGRSWGSPIEVLLSPRLARRIRRKRGEMRRRGSERLLNTAASHLPSTTASSTSASTQQGGPVARRVVPEIEGGVSTMRRSRRGARTGGDGLRRQSRPGSKVANVIRCRGALPAKCGRPSRLTQSSRGSSAVEGVVVVAIGLLLLAGVAGSRGGGEGRIRPDEEVCIAAPRMAAHGRREGRGGSEVGCSQRGHWRNLEL